MNPSCAIRAYPRDVYEIASSHFFRLLPYFRALSLRGLARGGWDTKMYCPKALNGLHSRRYLLCHEICLCCDCPVHPRRLVSSKKGNDRKRLFHRKRLCTSLVTWPNARCSICRPMKKNRETIGGVNTRQANAVIILCWHSYGGKIGHDEFYRDNARQRSRPILLSKLDR